MRVIAGKARGRRLAAVPGSKTRPTTDRVKEAIFSMIGPYFAGGLGLDLFAGTGGLGIEALSRGLDRVVFIDQDRNAVRVIHQNLDATNFSREAEVYRADAMKSLYWLKKRELRFDVIFLDPPYAQKRLVRLLQKIEEYGLLHRDGVIVVEHPVDQSLPARVGGFELKRTRDYGNIHISLFRDADVTEEDN